MTLPWSWEILVYVAYNILGTNVYVAPCTRSESSATVVSGTLIEKEVYIAFICSLCSKDIDISIEY